MTLMAINGFVKINNVQLFGTFWLRKTFLSLKDLSNLAQGQIVAIKVNVTRLYSETTHKTRSGEEIPRQEVTISDSTDSIKLVLYDQDINTLAEGKSYILKNVQLHIFKDKVYVNSTAEKKFDFKEIETISDPIDVNVGTEVKKCFQYHC